MSAYPISPTVKTAGAQYKGFQTRPRAAAGTYNVADASHPSAGDCSQCHSGTTAFTAIDKPANHIPYAASAQCTSCHTSGTNYQVMPSITNIHAWAPSTTTNCAQCHGAAAPSFAIPAANFSIVGLPSNHLPTTQSCDTCHRTTGWTPATFNHSAVAAGTCATCHNGTTARGKSATVLCAYVDALGPFGQWFAQLWAESLGKGGKGTTPVPSRGVTDQHSQLQLDLAGRQQVSQLLLEAGQWRCRFGGHLHGKLRCRNIAAEIRSIAARN